MGRRFAISDIHGCSDTFRKLVREVIRLEKNDILYLLGDYVNKGPDSKGVIDFIFDLREQGYQVKCLRGNHEQYLLDGLYHHDIPAFLLRGGDATLSSFGVKAIDAIPRRYISFIESLPYYFELEKYLLIHAGLNFNLPDPYTDHFSMLNIREMSVDFEKTGGRRIIHGHVPTPYVEIQKMIAMKNDHFSIDAGCVYDQFPGMSHLVALDIDTEKLYIQPKTD